MLHGPQAGAFDLLFRVPAECADLVNAGAAQIGIIPTLGLLNSSLATVPGIGIASCGAVRSILLVSRVEPSQIRILAADWSSRTSVALARIWLLERYRIQPVLIPHAPQLDNMLAQADAALIIGDPALHLEPAALPYRVYDLGQEWTEFTGLPMVYAVWAGPARHITSAVSQVFLDSWRYGGNRLEEIVAREASPRGISPDLARQYLQTHIRCELGDRELRGLDRFLSSARTLPVDVGASVTI